MFESTYDFIVHVAQTAPPAFWPLIVGMLFSSLVTQRVKFLFPIEWPSRLRAILTQVVAVVLGFSCTFALWPTVYGAFCGVIVGTAAPTLYWVTARAVGHFFPWLRDAASADVRDPE